MLKRGIRLWKTQKSLITVQDNTMLKPDERRDNQYGGLITVQDNTMLKLALPPSENAASLITVQDNTMLKPNY